MRKVGVLGIGLVASGGNTPDSVWERLVSGLSSYSPVPDHFSQYVRTKKANFAKVDFHLTGDERLYNLARRSIDQALSGHGYIPTVDALCIGSSSASYAESEVEGISFAPGHLTEYLAMEYHIMKKFQFSQACASSGAAILAGVDMIRLGRADTVLAGGVDVVTRCVMSAFESIRIHSDVCRPFDSDRSCINLGEASAFVLLAKEGIGFPLAYLIGGSSSTDAYDSAAPSGYGLMNTIREALSDADLPVVDFVIAHGTGTKLSDDTESLAIQRSLGKVRVSSFKGGLGHTQGASGAVSVVLAVKALQTQTIFPTVGLEHSDPTIASRIILNTTAQKDVRLKTVLGLSFGTWGTNVALVVEGI